MHARPLLRRASPFLQLAAALFCLWPRPATATNPDWTTPLKPFQITDHLYYVGSRDLAAYLVVTPAGDILINSNLPSSPPQIRRSIEQLGFHWKDVRILLISHAHFDHCSGSAAILKQTGARYEVMEGDVALVQSGGRKDFLNGGNKRDEVPQFPVAHVDRVLHDGDTVSLGGVTLVAHKTAGHTPGNTTWTTEDHVPGEAAAVTRHVVIVGSWNINPGTRLVAMHGKPASYPGIATDYQHTFEVLRSLPCDVFLGAHGGYFDMLAKLGRMPAEGDRVWIDPEGYQRAVAAKQQAFTAELARQQREQTPMP